jgi:RHS repeat-associated protein
MTATLPWPTAATFPVSIRRRGAARIRGKAPVCGGPIAGFVSVRRQTRPRSPGPGNTGNSLDSKVLANNQSSGNTMHVACYGYRWYDPRTGRWPSRDAIEEQGGLNLYGFVGNDGVHRWDLLGNMRCCYWHCAKVTLLAPYFLCVKFSEEGEEDPGQKPLCCNKIDVIPKPDMIEDLRLAFHVRICSDGTTGVKGIFQYIYVELESDVGDDKAG